MQQEVCGQILTGERALFQTKELIIRDSIFDDGESPLKESTDITEVCSNGNIRCGIAIM